jgi:hypothetical protein
MAKSYRRKKNGHKKTGTRKTGTRKTGTKRMGTRKTGTRKTGTRKHKGGSPTKEQLERASRGLKRQKRPSPLKIDTKMSPSEVTTYVYNPETPSHKKILAAKRKRNIINKPLSPSNELHILEIFNLPKVLPPHIDRDTQYFFIDSDESREIFTFGPDDVKLQPTGFAYIKGEFEKIV